MKPGPNPFAFLLSATLLLVVFPAHTHAAGQTSETFRVAADVFAQSAPALALGSAKYQASVSIGQWSLGAGPSAGPDIELAPGYQASTEGFDSDYDGVPDSADADSDGDGLGDAIDSRPYDTDNDGLNNVWADTDDDNEGLADTDEWSFGTSWIEPDSDDDTQNDYEEWIAGTLGNDPNDYFHISSITCSDTGSVSILWAGVAGRQYSVACTNSLQGAEEWIRLWSTNIVESGDVIYQRGATSHQALFFRVNVSRQ